MTRFLTLALAILLAGGIVAQPVQASSAPTLAGDTIVTGDGMWVADVEVPADVSISLGLRPDGGLDDVSFDSPSGLSAVILRNRDTGVGFYGVRLPAADGRRRHTVGIGLRTDDLFVPEVPAGRYQLFFISESPTTVRIHLEGLPGHTAISMTDVIADHVDGEIMQPNVEQDLRTPDGPAEIGADAYGLGWSGESRGTRTLVFDAFWYRGPTAPIPGGVSDQPLLNIGQTERCAYGDTLPLPPEASASMFAPGCPGGTTGSDTTILRAVQTASVVLFGIEDGAPGHEIGRGGYAVHTGIYDPGMTGFWIDLDG